MRLLDVQRRHQEIGRIRSGISEEAVSRRTGKEYRRPKKLGTFVLSSPNRRVIEEAARLYGGTVEAWEQQWRVITPVNELRCMVPDAEAALNQAWEMWSGGVCVRRCDGVTEHLRNTPCMCPQDGLDRADLASRGEACKAKTRINLILPDLPGLGVWRLETGSWNAAVETAGTIELLAAARDGAGLVIPAILRLERRESKRLVDIGVRPDPKRDVKGERAESREFFVPVLDVLATPRELTQLAARPLAAALPPPPGQMLALSAGREQTPAAGVRVEAPASWADDTPTPQQRPPAAPPAPGPPAGGPGGKPVPPVSPPAGVRRPTCPQDVADIAATATDPDVVRWLRSGATGAGWLDEYVSLDPTQPDAPHDSLRTVLDEHAARIQENR